MNQVERRGVLIFTAICSPLLAVSSQLFLLKSPGITKLQGFRLSFLTSLPTPQEKKSKVSITIVFVDLFLLFRAIPMAYGSSQARG